MSTLVKDAGLPSYVPARCPICGSETEVNDNLTKLYCTNMYCLGKRAERFNEFCTHFSIKGIGLAGLTRCVEENDLNNPYALVSMALDNELLYVGIPDSIQNKVARQLVTLYRDKLSLPDIIEGMYLPDVGKVSAMKLFSEVSEDEWNSGYLRQCLDYSFVREKLGISQLDSAKAYSVRQSIEDFYNDILLSVDIMDGFIEPSTASIELNGCYTDKVSTDYAKTKRDFYRLIADNFPDININWSKSVTKDTTFIISGTGAPTRKYNKAKELGIPIFDEESFINWISTLKESNVDE